MVSRQPYNVCGSCVHDLECRASRSAWTVLWDHQVPRVPELYGLEREDDGEEICEESTTAQEANYGGETHSGRSCTQIEVSDT